MELVLLFDLVAFWFTIYFNFYQINECEGLQDTIASLKQLLSEARDSAHTEKELSETEDTKEVLHRQAQVY